MPASTSDPSLHPLGPRQRPARLSAAVVLSQILLLEGKYDEYAELSTETLAPLLLKLRRSLAAKSTSGDLDLSRHVPDAVAGLALLPLTSKTFLSGLSSGAQKLVAVRWEALRGGANDDVERLAIDVVLEAANRQLGQEVERGQAVERITRNPMATSADARSGAKLAGGITDTLIEALRGVVSARAGLSR